MLLYVFPKRCWGDCILREAYVRFRTALDIFSLGGEVPESKVKCEPADISPMAEYAWYEWVKLRDTSVNFQDFKIQFGRHLGTAIDIGPAMAREVLNVKRKVVYRTSMRSLTPYEIKSISETRARLAFDEGIDKKLESSPGPRCPSPTTVAVELQCLSTLVASEPQPLLVEAPSSAPIWWCNPKFPPKCHQLSCHPTCPQLTWNAPCCTIHPRCPPMCHQSRCHPICPQRRGYTPRYSISLEPPQQNPPRAILWCFHPRTLRVLPLWEWKPSLVLPWWYRLRCPLMCH
jgi:hypothetical protein